MKEDSRKQAGEIMEIIRRFSEGLSISEIMEMSGDRLPRRTLLRRLTELANEGMIRREGDRRSARYFAIQSYREDDQSENKKENAYLPISIQGKEIQSYVKGPLGSRKPVGYQRSFVQEYRPNKSFYLSDQERKKLHQWGGTARQ